MKRLLNGGIMKSWRRVVAERKRRGLIRSRGNGEKKEGRSGIHN